jgi:DNA-binding LacI/PurR family transcriptional regulator
MKISEELNYQPNVMASALTGKKTYTIGLLIPDLVNPFFAELSRSIEDHAHELGYNLMICNTDNDMTKELKYIRVLQQKQVDGIIAATGVRNDAILKELVSKRMPITLVARETSVLSAGTVLVDDYTGAYNAISYLQGIGHKRIGVIAENLEVSSSRERVRGYKQAMVNAGLTYDEGLVKVSDSSVEGGKMAGYALLQESERPTAIFACNELLAIGAMQAARERKIAIPGQLSIIAFDNTILATVTDPPLTTVAQPIKEMGEQVVKLITQDLTDLIITRAAQRVVLLPELIIRGSTSSYQT